MGAKVEVFNQIVATVKTAREVHLAMHYALQRKSNVEVLSVIEGRAPYREPVSDSRRAHDVYSYLRDNCLSQKIEITVFEEKLN